MNRWTNWRPLVVLTALVMAMTSVVASPVSAEVDDGAPSGDGDTGRYVVVMDEVPNVTELGRDNVASAAAEQRSDVLEDAQEAAVRAAGLSANAINQRYTTSLNGFAIELNDSQLERIKGVDGVLMVLRDTMRYPQTTDSIDYLGLTGSGGAAHNMGYTGEGVVVGVIDSGIWPEHPSLEDDGSYSDPGLTLDDVSRSACDFGNTAHHPDDVPFECNNKLVGARQMLDTYRAVIGADPTEFDSARDDDGHGTHTATTAAGNADVEATLFGRNVGTISGVAPRAHVIAYKGLGVLGGFTSDLASAIDQAVLDGVDVINYSVGGGATNDPGADEIAFLFASDAGVHVATSAGNNGPGASTVGGPGDKPWLTTVGASTQPRFRQGSVRFNAANHFYGASVTEGTGRLNVVDAEFAGGDLCLPGTLDPAEVAGKMVLCRRGAIARAAKSLAVMQAGGAAMVLYNNSDNDNLFTDTHWVPSVHINNTDGLAMKAHVAAFPTRRALLQAGQETTLPGDTRMTFFSSRGPNSTGDDVIKPDITAPGHQITAGHTPLTNSGPQGNLFQSISGTSMSSPHVAGLMALVDQAHPDWSPAALKSALMTTSHQDVVKDDKVTPADPFDMGAGEVDPGRPNRKNSIWDPGLVYNAGFNDYLAYLCDAAPAVFTNAAATCAALAGIGFSTDASDLNLASLAVAELAGSQTLTRTVTSVATARPPQEYRAKVEAPDGYEVTVTPSVIRVRPGESATFQVTITNVSAPVGEWRFGSLTWDGGNYEVRSPIAVRGASLATPAKVDGSGEDGSASVPVRFGYTGDYTAAAHGLEAAMVIEDTVPQDPDQTFDPTDGFSKMYTFEASGTAFMRFRLPPDAVDDPDKDLDMFVYGPAGNQIASSTAGGTDEQVDLVLPMDGTYTVWVHGWQTVNPTSDFTLYAWVISATPGGNMSVDSAPASAVTGSLESVDVSWTGAAAGEWHLGAVSHSDASGVLALTLVEVDNRGLPA